MDLLKLYNDSIKITESSALQVKIFKHWQTHQHDGDLSCMAFDTETTGLLFNEPTILHIAGKFDIHCNSVQAFGISLCIYYKETVALFWAHLGTELYSRCCELLSKPGLKVAHNARYDLKVGQSSGFEVAGPVHCTLTMARLHWNRRMAFDLKGLSNLVCPELAGWEDELKAVLRNLRSTYTRAGYQPGYVNYSFLPTELVGKYAMVDAYITWLLYLRLAPQIRTKHEKVYARERKIIYIVMDIEARGVQLDRLQAKRETKKLKIASKRFKRKLVRWNKGEINPGSPKQLLAALLKLKVPKSLLMLKGKLSTSKPVLAELQDNDQLTKRQSNFISALLAYRSCEKLIGTYFERLYKQAHNNRGTVYSNLNPTDTRTGRMTSNLFHGIPRTTSGFSKYNPVRKCIVCRKGFTNFFIDYSQMEMIIFGITAKEPKIIDGFLKGLDMHASTAIDMYGDEALDKDGNVIKTIRQKTKGINFGIIYGMGGAGLATFLKIPQLKGINLRRDYLNTYPRVEQFVQECKRELARKGYVQDIFSRRYNIEPAQAYKCVNALVQGGCAQILKIALIQITEYLDKHPEFKRYINILMVIHDEIVFEISNQLLEYKRRILIKNIQKRMEEITELMAMGIKLRVDVSCSQKSWEDKNAYK